MKPDVDLTDGNFFADGGARTASRRQGPAGLKTAGPGQPPDSVARPWTRAAGL